MLEQFTSRARRVVVLATEEARSRGHETIAPEHLLLGILRDADGMAVKVLERLGVQPGALRASVEGLLTETPASPAGSAPAFSPELRYVLAAALESRFQPHHVIGTENLLLGLLAYEGSAANHVLRAVGVDVERARGVTSLFYDSMAIPITSENIRFIATSKWRIET
jgi:ATP-dependent Clp protease ATP-binding subunit ClpC